MQRIPYIVYIKYILFKLKLQISVCRFFNKIPFKCWALFNCLCWYSIILL